MLIMIADDSGAFSGTILDMNGPSRCALLLFLLFSTRPADAALRTWVAASPGSASTGTNWSPTGPVADGDDILFDGSGSGDCSWDISSSLVSVASFTVTSAYTGTLTFTTHTVVLQSFSEQASVPPLMDPGVALVALGDFESTMISTVTGSAVSIEGTGLQVAKGQAPDLTVNKPSGSMQVDSAGFTVNGNLTITTGTVELTALRTLTVKGDWIQNAGEFRDNQGGTLVLEGDLNVTGGSFAPINGKVEFRATTTGTTFYITLPSGGALNNVIVAVQDVVATALGSTLTVNGTLTVESGRFLLNAGNHIFNSDVIFNADVFFNAILELQGTTATFHEGVSGRAFGFLFSAQSQIVLGSSQTINMAPLSVFIAAGSTITSTNPGIDFYGLSLNGFVSWVDATVRSVNSNGIDIKELATVLIFRDVFIDEVAANATALVYRPSAGAVLQRVSFLDTDIVTNVQAPNLFGGEKLRMYQAVGPRAGPSFEDDPLNAIDWVNLTPADLIFDLAAVTGSQEGSVNLTWTAPFDADGDSPSDVYEVFARTTRSHNVISETDTLQITSGLPQRDPPETSQSMTVTGLKAGRFYDFTVRVKDEDGNLSQLSNNELAQAFDASAPVLTLSTTATANATEFGGRTVGIPSDLGSLLATNDPLSANTVSDQSIILTAITDRQSAMLNQVLQASFTYNDLNGTVDFGEGFQLQPGFTYRIDITSDVLNAFNIRAASTSLVFTTAFDVSTATRLMDGGVVLDVPAGALPAGGYVLLNSSASVSALTSNPQAIQNANEKLKATFGPATPLSTVVEVDAFDSGGRLIASPLRPFRLSISYPDSEPDGIVDNTDPPVRVSDLALWQLKTPENVWVRLPGSGPDTVNKVVAGDLTHLSIFAVFNVAAADLSRLKAFPNPFRPASGHTTVTFVNLPLTATIRVFTIAGDLVRRLEENDGDGVLVWNGRNSGGQLLAPDVYLYLVESSGNKATGKLVVGP